METQKGLCCGLVEIDGISRFTKTKDAESFLIDLFDCSCAGFDDGVKVSAGIVIFTGANRSRTKAPAYTTILSTYIEHNNLGVVDQAVSAKNPNTGRHIHTFLWYPDPAGVKKWFARVSNHEDGRK